MCIKTNKETINYDKDSTKRLQSLIIVCRGVRILYLLTNPPFLEFFKIFVIFLYFHLNTTMDLKKNDCSKTIQKHILLY